MRQKTILLFFLAITAILTALPFSGCSRNSEEPRYIRSVEELQTAGIGVTTGTIYGDIIRKVFPNARLEYFNTTFDIAAALDSGKIAAGVYDEHIADELIRRKPTYTVLDTLSSDSYGFAFPKDSEKSRQLWEQMNGFLTQARQNGVMNELEEIWFGTDEDRKTVDRSGLTGENGTLHFAVCNDGAEPFLYMKDGELVGFEADLVTRFCRANGYGLEIVDYTFSGLLAAVASGKADFGGSGLSITEERKQSVLFSDPICTGGIVLLVKSPAPLYNSLEDLNGKRGAVITGSIFDRSISEKIPDAKIEYLNSASDLAAALDRNKIDFYVVDEPIAQYLISQYRNQMLLGCLDEDHYGFMFQKGNEKGALLCDQMNEYLARHKADGTLAQIIDAWIGADAAGQTLDYDDLPADNGVLNCAISTNVGAPYAYVQNGKYVGYEIAITVSFCREYGYGLKFYDSSFSGMLAEVASGKCDLAVSGISITEERKQSMLFSDPSYDGGIAVVVKKYADDAEESGNFLQSVADNFNKTFLVEDRWKLFLSGVGITMLITVLSALFGSALGFGFYLIYRKNRRFLVSAFDWVGTLLEKMPVVVILMILYYIIFGRSDISGVVISIVGFTLLFAFTVLGLLRSGANAVDHGQTEAALALGYTENQTYLRVIFPQSVRHFMPGYKGALVSLVKDTAIVGYIAVQDLTKISDIVRSRTYEAFFPLIATAVIYFLLAQLLTTLIRRVEINVDPKHRKADRILKGVKKK